MTVNPIEWQPLPTLWPDPAAWTDVGELMLLVFSPDGVPTWEVRRRTKVGRSDDDLIASGTADTFEAPRGIGSGASGRVSRPTISFVSRRGVCFRAVAHP
jgi:hypothetical protein